MSKQADITWVKIAYNIPATLDAPLVSSIKLCDLHTDMCDHLLDLPRANETNCGHWATVIFEYESISQASNFNYQDSTAVQTIVNQFINKAMEL